MDPRRRLHALPIPDKDVVVVDAPGRWDTRGDEIDIATSASCAEIAKKCRTGQFEGGVKKCLFQTFLYLPLPGEMIQFD